jgi:hypothetical protein
MQVARKVKSPDHSPMLIVSRTGQEELRIGDGGDEEGKGGRTEAGPSSEKNCWLGIVDTEA